jgi:hypothetical protein
MSVVPIVNDGRQEAVRDVRRIAVAPGDDVVKYPRGILKSSGAETATVEFERNGSLRAGRIEGG